MVRIGSLASAILALLPAPGCSEMFARPVGNLLDRISSPAGKVHRQSLAKEDDTDPLLLYPEFNLSTPIDHFHNDSMYTPHSDGKFNLRYWFDATYYEPGGPVFVLCSGESSGEDRLPFLQKGIVNKIVKATHGLGVILEHRFYGTSQPSPDLSTANLRFLTTDQSLADTAYFASNVVFEGLEHLNLTAAKTPWIAYGGSYAGAYAAFLRKLYPDVFWGAISSSGVTEAIYDYWEYYEPIRTYGPKECIATQQNLTHAVDTILLGPSSSVTALQTAFQLPNLTHVKDFANVISYGPSGWQGRNWDPAVGSNNFAEYCDTLSNDSVVYPSTSKLAPQATELLNIGGYADYPKLVNRLLNYIGFINATYVAPCKDSGKTQDECFSKYNVADYQKIDLDQAEARSWPYQYCTQWGYLQTGSGVPDTTLPLISRTLDLEYMSLVCKYSFNITTPPDVNAINKYGGFNISYPRLAFVDGEQDPWRPATPHAVAVGAEKRPNTSSEPFILIDGAVHHWDENGLFPNQTTANLPPLPVRDAQDLELAFVQEWLLEAESKWPRIREVEELKRK